jgi:hypothetical protein
MMKALHVSLLFLSLLGAQTPPEPVAPVTPLDLGAPITVPVGKKCVLKADTTAKKVTWRIPAGVDALSLNGKELAVWALPGTYTFTAMVPSGDDVVSKELVLTVVGAQPPPIVDTLAADIQAAFDGEPSSVLVNGSPRLKSLDAVALAEAYRAHARALPTFATANDAANDLLTVRKAAVAERVPSVRLIAGKELAKILPSAASAQLTDQMKKDAAALLNRVAVILDNLQ